MYTHILHIHVYMCAYVHRRGRRRAAAAAAAAAAATPRAELRGGDRRASRSARLGFRAD